jgi:hypothetical protein
MGDLELLLSRVDESQGDDFASYVRGLVDDDDRFGIDLDCLGFMDDYVHIAALAKRKAEVADLAADPLFGGRRERVTVFDVGCCTALQHVLFDDRVRYVGIDDNGDFRPRFFRSRCEFVHGYLRDVAASLSIGSNDIGVANMSLLYTASADDRALFDRLFRRKIIL